jgi:hypothetical protein
MSSTEAIRWTGGLVSWAILLQSIELSILSGSRFFRVWNRSRSILALGILLAVLIGLPVSPWFFGILLVMSWIALWPWLGLFNGGSDTMGILVLSALFAQGFGLGPEQTLLWIGILSSLSYFLSGLRKSIHRDWWSGQALRGFLDDSRVSARGVSCRVRKSLFHRLASPGVLVFQMAVPGLLWCGAAPVMVLTAALFHLLNFVFFGLNRFFWVWISTYPALLWLGSWLHQS